MSTPQSVAANFLLQVGEQTFYKVLTSGFKKNMLRPWMKVREIDFMKGLLRNLAPKKCLEWGTGYSTLYYPDYISSEAQWLSIEHEKEWFAKIQAMNKKGNVHIHHVEPNQFPWTDAMGDGSYEDLTDYINFPEKYGRFDFVFVDGRARVECIKKASQLLSEHGVVILHDANRTRYENPWKDYKYQALFRDYRDIVGGFWIGSHSVEISTLIDVEKEKKLWKIYEKIGKNSFGKLLRL